ncbi:MAG: hypothetical protein CMM44_06960 [Rhodospirillaceae bacterium]|nr:hypothetical protein [Rhodospirillaceae bacterium]
MFVGKNQFFKNMLSVFLRVYTNFLLRPQKKTLIVAVQRNSGVSKKLPIKFYVSCTLGKKRKSYSSQTKFNFFTTV